MKPQSIAVFYSNDQMFRSGDQFYPYRQDSALFSLTGIDQEGTILILYPDSKKKLNREILFILPEDHEHTIWNGDRLSSSDAGKISGISTIMSLDKWDKVMQGLFNEVHSIYINTHAKENFSQAKQTQNERKAAELIKMFPHYTFHRSQPILQKMAMIKHPVEVDLVKKAIDVTGKAFERVLHTVRPGMKEYEVEAELTYILTKNGCKHAFEPIVASGKSACTLHYISNDRMIKPGTLILIDFGAEYANMASDMTRTIPASGKFSTEQKKIYLSVLKVLDEVTNLMRPGITISEINKEAAKLIQSELIKLKIISRDEIKRQDSKSPLWKKYFMHGVSHHLGYDVHDISDRNAPLRPGMILTCEPGIYLPEMNLGIRLENDILITRSGSRNLMSSIPIDPDEIEFAMQSKHN
jgi:Xaa-Pro aminopeptidase